VMISLAQVLNLEIVAEGVETDDQWRLLRGMENSHNMLIQGYLFSRPLPADRFQQLLQQGKLNLPGESA